MAFQIRSHGGSAFQPDWYGSQFRSDALDLQLLGVADLAKSAVAKLSSEREILARLKRARAKNPPLILHSEPKDSIFWGILTLVFSSEATTRVGVYDGGSR